MSAQAAGEPEEGFVDVGSPFPADPQPPEAVQPRRTALDHPAVGAQPGAVSYSAPGDRGHDAAFADLVAVDVVVVAAVGEQGVWPAAGPADATADRRDGVDQRQELGDVVAVATGQQDCERSAVPVGDEVVFRTSSAPRGYWWASQSSMST